MCEIESLLREKRLCFAGALLDSSQRVCRDGVNREMNEGTKWWRGIKADLSAEDISGENFRNRDWRKGLKNFLKKGRDGRVDDGVETSDSECESY